MNCVVVATLAVRAVIWNGGGELCGGGCSSV